MTLQPEKLQVAFPRARNMQRTPPELRNNPCSALATPNPESLGAQDLDVQRLAQRTCNNAPESLQQTSNETGPKVARLQPNIDITLDCQVIGPRVVV